MAMCSNTWGSCLAGYRGIRLGICLHPASVFWTQLLVKAAITILLQMPFCTRQHQEMALRQTKILSRHRETCATIGNTLEKSLCNVYVYGDHENVLQYLPLGRNCLLLLTCRAAWSRGWRTFSVKGQMVTILGSIGVTASHMIFIFILFCFLQFLKNIHNLSQLAGHIKQSMKQIWPTGCSLPILGVKGISQLHRVIFAFPVFC